MEEVQQNMSKASALINKFLFILLQKSSFPPNLCGTLQVFSRLEIENEVQLTFGQFPSLSGQVGP